MIGITLAAGQTLTAKDVKKISKTIKRMIKAAEDKRGKEVLKLAKRIFGTVPYLSMNEKDDWERFERAYQERFGK